MREVGGMPGEAWGRGEREARVMEEALAVAGGAGRAEEGAEEG